MQIWISRSNTLSLKDFKKRFVVPPFIPSPTPLEVEELTLPLAPLTESYMRSPWDLKSKLVPFGS